MDLRKGYRQTELGVVPEDWEVKNLSKIGSFKKGRGIKKDETSLYGLPCIRYGEIYTRHNDYIKQFYSFIPLNIANQSQRLTKGDLLFTGSGETAEEIGKCVAFLGSEEAFAGGDIIILSPNGYDSTFLGFLLNSDKIVKQKCKMAQGDAVVHIYANNLGKVMVASPPTKAEQTAIATALSDADELISSLEELITKKKNIKQGTMQQLLTGKKRLPGFGGGWEVKKLGTMIKLQGGYAFKSDSFQNEGVPIVRISNIDNSYVDLNDVVYYKEFLIPNEFVVNKGDVLIAMSGATTGKIGIYNFNFYSYQNQRVGKFVVYNSKKNDLNFISHLVRSERFKNNLQKQIAQGAQPNISGKQIESIELDIPVNIAEQTAIANILSDMDAEIGSLEQKRDKYKMIKQGMMQELLTGKTRLV